MDIFREKEADRIYTRYVKEDETRASGYEMHIHERCELYYFLNGKASYMVEGSEYPLKRGDMLLMRPGEAHCVRILEKSTYERYAVNFPADLFDGIDPERRLMKPFFDRKLGVGNHYENPEGEGHFRKMCETYTDDYERFIAVYTSILEIMTELPSLNTLRRKKTDRPSGLSEKLLKYVNENLYSDISLSDVASHFYISVSQLGRVFRQATGAPLWEYVTAKRLIAAKELIDSGMYAGEAALKCGFKDYSSFYRAYVKRYDKSPKSAV
ncbi:MAG: helix-turn-helix transcriptional regulator [Lachnospiraceae bacterium]|nr:helix-turn-helix transcriptional regulator [Lachnospiraceae bacterium]